MGVNQRLLEDIAAHPEDDTPRLIYADWLEEHGRGKPDHDRAALIRDQVALARLDPGDPHRQALEREADTLLERHHEEWQRPLRELGATGIQFHRGFPSRIVMDAADFLAHGQEALRLAPGPTLRLTCVNDVGVPALAQSPLLAGLRGLELSYTGMRDADAQALATSPHLDGLQELDLRGNNLDQACWRSCTRRFALIAQAPQRLDWSSRGERLRSFKPSG
jgi:uncharacterized protein (TIGR02996 family)